MSQVPETPTATMPVELPPQSPAMTSPPPKPSSQFRTPKSTASRSRDSRLPAAKTSVFDRLYRTQTASSRAHKSNYSYTSRRASPAANVEDAAQIFDRLHITGTVSTTSKRTKTPTRGYYSTPRRKKQSPYKNIPSTRTPLVNTPNRGRQPPSFVYSPRMKPLTKLYFDSKYHPGIGIETVEPIKLGFSFFQAFCDYENGALDSKQIAREIIVAFFKKDFPSGRHWELHEPTVEDRPGEEHSYNVKMSAAYDWDDERRAAFAQGVVRCVPSAREVRVLNYIYDVNTF